MPELTTLGQTALRAFLRPQTYLNLVYLVLAFPLGLAYFLFLVVGLTVGFALVLTLVGIPILLLMHLAAWVLMKLERWLAIRLLGVDIPPMSPVDPQGPLWKKAHRQGEGPVDVDRYVLPAGEAPAGIRRLRSHCSPAQREHRLRRRSGPPPGLRYTRRPLEGRLARRVPSVGASRGADRRPIRERAQLHGVVVRPLRPPDARDPMVGERTWYRFHMNMTARSACSASPLPLTGEG